MYPQLRTKKAVGSILAFGKPTAFVFTLKNTCSSNGACRYVLCIAPPPPRMLLCLFAEQEHCFADLSLKNFFTYITKLVFVKRILAP